MSKTKHKKVSVAKIAAKIIQVEISKLKPYANNSRIHSDEQIDEIVNSIKRFGWTNPMQIDADFNIIAGHGRLMAAQRMGMEKVPCIVLEHLTETERRALVIADNKLAENAEWDWEKLQEEITALDAEGFDLDLLGFDQSELDELLLEDDAPGDDADDEQEEEIEQPPSKPITRAGEIWHLGNHRLMCGDATVEADIKNLVAGDTVNLCYSDPPYGIDLDLKGGNGNGLAKKNDYKKIQGDKTIDVARKAYKLAANISETIVYWGANYFDFLPPAKCWIAWDKRGDLPEDDFCGAELAYTNADKHSKIITVKWKGMIKEGETGQKRVHPNQKPIQLASDVFKYLDAGKTVLDLFGGSGSTIMACEKTGRRCLTMELEPSYCDVIVKRWQELTGETVTLGANGKTFAEVSIERK